MKDCVYIPRGVCSYMIKYSLDDENKIHNLVFSGGCNGNLKAIGKLLEGMDAEKAIKILEGNDCKGRGTSCADQLTKSLKENI
jgi:uncharacterized protein (TIGR03905 family)